MPVAEAFEQAAPGGMPGRELLLEHVHPTRDGVVLMARTFYEALRDAKFLGNTAREAALRMAAEAGYRWLRQEFTWEDIEIHGKGNGPTDNDGQVAYARVLSAMDALRAAISGETGAV